MKNMHFIAIITLLFGVFAGCTEMQKPSSNAVQIRVAYWGTMEESKIIRDTIKPWQKKHPGIQVVLEHIPSQGDISAYTSKILMEIAGDSGPDVMFVEVDMFINFFLKQALLNLTDPIKNDPSFDVNSFYPEVVQRFTRDGKIYVIPRDTAPIGVIYYNKSIFDLAGVPYPKDDWTWDDLVAIGQKLTKTNAEGIVQQYGFFTWFWQNFIYSEGGRYVDDVANPTKCTFNSMNVRKGLQFYHDLMYKYKIHPGPQAGVGMYEIFETGRLAMAGSGIWDVPRYKKLKQFNWGIVPWPKTPDGQLKIATGGSGYGIFAGTKHPKESWEVLKCLAGEEGQIMLAKTGLAQPANMKIADGIYWAKSKEPPLNKGIVNGLVKDTIYAPFHKDWMQAFFTVVVPQVNLYFMDKQDLDKTVETIDREVNKLLKNNK
jgi:multiple sugar transport system substrate-binding protein